MKAISYCWFTLWGRNSTNAIFDGGDESSIASTKPKNSRLQTPIPVGYPEVIRNLLAATEKLSPESHALWATGWERTVEKYLQPQWTLMNTLVRAKKQYIILVVPDSQSRHRIMIG